MGEFVRILKISKTVIVSLQLLQTMSIMIQNLKSEHSICKLVIVKEPFYFQKPKMFDTIDLVFLWNILQIICSVMNI